MMNEKKAKSIRRKVEKEINASCSEAAAAFQVAILSAGVRYRCRIAWRIAKGVKFLGLK